MKIVAAVASLACAALALAPGAARANDPDEMRVGLVTIRPNAPAFPLRDCPESRLSDPSSASVGRQYGELCEPTFLVKPTGDYGISVQSAYFEAIFTDPPPGAQTCTAEINLPDSTSAVYKMGWRRLLGWVDRPVYSFTEPYEAPGAQPLRLRSGEATVTLECPQTDTVTARFFVIEGFARARNEALRSITLNNAALATNSPDLDITASWLADDFFDKVMISNDGSFPPHRTRVLPLTSDVVPWTIDAEQSERMTRVVYLRFHDVRTGTWSAAVSDDIILDTVAPRIEEATVVPGESDRAARSKRVRLALRAVDLGSGVTSVQVSSTRSAKGATRARYRERVTLARPAGGAAFVRVRDGAGNWSRWRSLT